MAKAKSGGLASLLDVAGTKDAADKKSVPTIPMPEALAPLIAQWLQAKRDLDTAEALKASAAGGMIDTATELRLNACQQDRKIHASIVLNGGKHGQIKFTQAGKMKQMPAEKALDRLQEIFGPQFSKYFTLKPQIKIKDSITDEQAEKLAKALGQIFGSSLKDMVTVAPVVAATEVLFSDMIFDPAVKGKIEVAQGEGLCEMNAAYFTQ